MMTKARPLPRSFYDRPVREVARDLLGKRLIRRTRGAQLSGLIVEVEAYLGPVDSASHSYRGMTPRNRAMFGPPGHAYVYSIHSRYCLNAVTEGRGAPTAVLIRALEPLEGREWMWRRRGCPQELDIARGPARICEALAIDRGLDGWDLTRTQRLWITAADARQIHQDQIAVSPRIGVTSAQDQLLRFFVDGSRFVSGPNKLHSRPLV
jgi:DNA-3-methyladenine glycosylase